jgi:hypothetical protein
MNHDISEADKVKLDNAIGMALDFTKMIRLFKRGTRAGIESQLRQVVADLERVSHQQGVAALQSRFCKWFTANVVTAEKRLKNGRLKVSGPASYGQAAKVFDVSLKALVYYCQLSPRLRRTLISQFL